jgi:lysozyme family protein
MDLNRVLEAALNYTLAREGGWANDASDHGGATKYGVTIGVFLGLGREFDLNHDGKLDVEDLKLLTADQARAIYRKQYWIWDHFDCAHVDPRVMIKQFDTGVNCGVKTSIRLLQRAASGASKHAMVFDGVMGPGTLDAINASKQDELLHRMCDEQAARYHEIVANDPSQAKFLNGWLIRAAKLPPPV